MKNLISILLVIVLALSVGGCISPDFPRVQNQARVVADQYNVRSAMMAAAVVGTQLDPPRAPTQDEADLTHAEFSGDVNVKHGLYTICFDGAVAIGGYLETGGSRSGNNVVVGALECQSCRNHRYNKFVIQVE